MQRSLMVIQLKRGKETAESQVQTKLHWQFRKAMIKGWLVGCAVGVAA